MSSSADDSSFCSEDSFVENDGYNNIGPATDLNRELLNAARGGDLNRSQKLVEAGADINYNEWTNFNLFTPLCLAIQFNHVDMISWLLQQPELDIQKPCCVGTPLNLASSEASTRQSAKKIVEMLLAHGARDHTAIVKADDLQTIDRLLQHGADINTANDDGNTLLHTLCDSYRDGPDQVEMILAVLKRGGNVHAKNKRGETPLHNAASHSHVNIATQLLDVGGADVNAADNRGDTPLLNSNQPGMVALLLEKGADVNASDNEGSTKLHDIACMMESSPGAAVANLNLLFQAGINPNARGYKGRTALVAAIEHSKQDVVDHLLQGGADPNILDDKGRNALHSTSHLGRTGYLDLLIEAGTNINEPTTTGLTALQLAITSVWNWGEGAAVQKLLDHGADVNSRCPKGSTPLSGAISRHCRDLKVIEMLVEHGANVNALTTVAKEEDSSDDDDSSHDSGEDSDDSMGVDKQKKADTNKETPLVEETPLHWASAGMHQDVVLLLLNNGAEPNSINGRGETPLFHASKLGLHHVVARLLEMGVTIDTTSGNTATPLSVACEGGHLDVIYLLTPSHMFM